MVITALESTICVTDVVPSRVRTERLRTKFGFGLDCKLGRTERGSVRFWKGQAARPFRREASSPRDENRDHDAERGSERLRLHTVHNELQ